MSGLGPGRELSDLTFLVLTECLQGAAVSHPSVETSYSYNLVRRAHTCRAVAHLYNNNLNLLALVRYNVQHGHSYEFVIYLMRNAFVVVAWAWHGLLIRQ